MHLSYCLSTSYGTWSLIRSLRPSSLKLAEGPSTEMQLVCFVYLDGFAVRLPSSMRLDELDYHLPREHIAQRPLARRDASRLLFLDRSSGVFEDRLFTECLTLLRGDELLVFNKP